MIEETGKERYERKNYQTSKKNKLEFLWGEKIHLQESHSSVHITYVNRQTDRLTKSRIEEKSEKRNLNRRVRKQGVKRSVMLRIERN